LYWLIDTLGQVGIEIILAVEQRAQVDLGLDPSPVRRLLDAFSLITGSMPGKPASMNETWLLVAAEFVEAPETAWNGEDLGMDFIR